MTLTFELTPEAEAALREMAQEKGLTPEAYCLELLGSELEDLCDIVELRRADAENDPAERRSLDELREAIYGETADVAA